MKKEDQIRALLNAYIELAQNEHYNDAQIIDALTDIFDEAELIALGYGEFIHDYFADAEG